MLIEPHRTAVIAYLVRAVSPQEAAAADGAVTPQPVNGDGIKAAEILLGYLAAKPRPTAELVHVPDLAAAEGLEQKCAAVINAVANGEITSAAGRDLLAVISDLAKVIEVGDLEDRLRVLEGKPPRRVAAVASKPADGLELV